VKAVTFGIHGDGTKRSQSLAPLGEFPIRLQDENFLRCHP